jgi:hypothetical protein
VHFAYNASFKLKVIRYAVETNHFVARRKYGIYGTSMQDWRKAKEQLLYASIRRNVFFRSKMGHCEKMDQL